MSVIKEQKFHKGDLVHIAKNLGSSMFHFPADINAIVIGSYADQFGANNNDVRAYSEYTLYLEEIGEVSWYNECQLTLLKKNSLELLQQWKTKAAEIKKQQSDLDWIFSHGKEVLSNMYGASIVALANCLGFTEDGLWGKHGEGIAYYNNCYKILEVAYPFLIKGDKESFLKIANESITF